MTSPSAGAQLRLDTSTTHWPRATAAGSRVAFSSTPTRFRVGVRPGASPSWFARGFGNRVVVRVVASLVVASRRLSRDLAGPYPCSRRTSAAVGQTPRSTSIHGGFRRPRKEVGGGWWESARGLTAALGGVSPPSGRVIVASGSDREGRRRRGTSWRRPCRRGGTDDETGTRRGGRGGRKVRGLGESPTPTSAPISVQGGGHEAVANLRTRVPPRRRASALRAVRAFVGT